MSSASVTRRPRNARAIALLWPVCLTLASLAALTAATSAARAQTGDSSAKSDDPRSSLAGGHWVDAAEASHNLDLIAHRARPKDFINTDDPGDFHFINSDIAFSGHFAVQGNFNGFQIWDISDPASPTLRTSLVCPGGQGDPSIYGKLMFFSVEERRARVDCGTQGVTDSVSADRFRGVRIFDISDIDHPKQVAAVQTCRGSHTHTLVPDPKNPKVVYLYVSGTSPVRPGAELAGCSTGAPDVNPNTSLFRIEVIRVPVDTPQAAKVVNAPRIFADAATGAANGLWKGGSHGNGTQTTNVTDQCHDITVYLAIGLGAGACSGNGILLDVRKPGDPKRIADVSDPNFAYWHSATFSNDGKKVIFTDEWGGGIAPRCRATDPPKWGADAIFTLVDNKFQLAGYYKMPAVQTDKENCVAHNGSLIPVPGRDIMVQAWYQGGVSVFDFTDPAHPQEIAYFDRGPFDVNKLVLVGFWSAFWYNGYIYGSEIGRGLDVFQLKPSEYLSQSEIDAANLVHFAQYKPSDQQKFTWPASFAVARAYLDQLKRKSGLSSDQTAQIASELDQAEHLQKRQQRGALKKLASQVSGDAKGSADPDRVRALASSIKDLANANG